MSLQGSEKHAAQQHADRTADIAPTPESIRGPRILKNEATKGRFYQAVFQSGNVYYVQALGDGEFKVISHEVLRNHHMVARIGSIMDMFDGDQSYSGKLYKFTQKPVAKPVEPEPAAEEHPLAKRRGKQITDLSELVKGRQYVLTRNDTMQIATFKKDSLDFICPDFVNEAGSTFCHVLNEPSKSRGFRATHELLPEPVVVEPIPAGLQIGDRVRYDATKHSGAAAEQHGVLGTVVNRISADTVKVNWDNGWGAGYRGNDAACCIKVSPDAVSAAEAHQILAAEEPAPLSPVDACKGRIDQARSDIKRLESDLRVAKKVLADAQQDLQNELKGYLPEPQVAYDPYLSLMRDIELASLRRRLTSPYGAGGAPGFIRPGAF